jgi:hypothetical protein
MSQLMAFFIAFWTYLPWVAIGLMAALAWRKRQESKALLMQALGAGGAFLFGMGHWLVIQVLIWMNAPKLAAAASYIFAFLSFMALLIFAAGYCGERFAKRKPEQVVAVPAE